MGPIAFRDGIFSQTDPMSRGGYQHAYSDGSLGANPAVMRKLAFMRRRRLGPMRVVRRGASGLGMTSSTKAALATAGVLVLALVAMPLLGSRKK